MAELAMIAYNDEAEAQRAAQRDRLSRGAAVRPRRVAGLSLSQRARRRPGLPRDRAHRVERHPGRCQRRDVGRRHAGQRPQRLQPRSGRSVARARGLAARQYAAGLVLRALAGRRDGDDLRLSLQDVVDRRAIRRSCTRLARPASAASGTFATREVNHYRWVHNNDVVTRVPPVWMGYRHCGNEIYLDRYGRIRKLTGVWRSRDRWRAARRLAAVEARPAHRPQHRAVCPAHRGRGRKGECFAGQRERRTPRTILSFSTSDEPTCQDSALTYSRHHAFTAFPQSNAHSGGRR